MGTFRLKNIGRERVCRDVTCDAMQLYKEVKKHLASKAVGIEWDDDGKRATVFAGDRTVGEIVDLGGGLTPGRD